MPPPPASCSEPPASAGPLPALLVLASSWYSPAALAPGKAQPSSLPAPALPPLPLSGGSIPVGDTAASEEGVSASTLLLLLLLLLLLAPLALPPVVADVVIVVGFGAGGASRRWPQGGDGTWWKKESGSRARCDATAIPSAEFFELSRASARGGAEGFVAEARSEGGLRMEGEGGA